MANEILLNEDTDGTKSQSKANEALVAWVLSKVEPWIDYRDNNYKTLWDEYYRLWRGKWTQADKTRNSERSKLIVPALQQAVEAAVAEMQEATFGKKMFFDIVDDYADQSPMDVQQIRKQLHEDLELARIQTCVNTTYLNGGLYGTGIAKCIVEEIEERIPMSVPREDGAMEGGVGVTKRVQVRWVPVNPRDFAIDPTATGIEDGLGCAHITIQPKHSIVSKQRKGIYFDEDLGSYMDDVDVSALGEQKDRIGEDKVKILEYAGLVPKSMLDQVGLKEDEELVNLFEDDIYEDEMVEALVTIGNDAVLLKAVENPYLMKDRPFVAYPHDIVPDRFWGRGIAEKGYNPQKALDAELRARIDAMALAAHPMMGMDATRIPRGVRPEVMPGKTLITNGPPSEILYPFNFGTIPPATFSQSGELERMIQMGTGSIDSAAPIGVSPRNSTASGMSMMLSGAIKRSKRTMMNVEENFLIPLIRKTAWRYMQFDPERYPVKDYKFMPRTTLGIMARELEQQQLISLLSTAPPESPAYWLLLKGIYNNSSLEDKDQAIQVVEAMMQQAMQPKEPPPDPMVLIKQEELKIKASEAQAGNEKARAESILALAKAEAEKAGIQIEAYLAKLQSMQPKEGKTQ